MRPDVLVITGPTATGKTALGVRLAQKLGGEVVSADSMQVYRGMDIGTAKPSLAERGEVPHHMIDVADLAESYSAARYAREAGEAVDGIIARRRLPILVGGTGLYIDSLISGRSYAERGDGELRERLSARYDDRGADVMLRELYGVDPRAAERLHKNDKKRIVRALEIFYLTGKAITEHDIMTRTAPPRYSALKIALSYENRAELYARIDARVDAMIAAGLEREVRALLERGLTARHTAMAAIGYKELAAPGNIEDAVARIKAESRRYAKRQLTWLRRDKDIKWILWNGSPDFAEGVRISTEYLE